MIKEQEAPMPTAEMCRKHGRSQGAFYKYKSRYGGVEVSDVARLRTLEGENAKLKRLLAGALGQSSLWISQHLRGVGYASGVGPCGLVSDMVADKAPRFIEIRGSTRCPPCSDCADRLAEHVRHLLRIQEHGFGRICTWRVSGDVAPCASSARAGADSAPLRQNSGLRDLVERERIGIRSGRRAAPLAGSFCQ